MSIKAVFFDFGNVCVPFTFTRFFKRFTEETGVEETRVRRALLNHENHGYSTLFEDFECGRVSPSQFFHELTTALGIAGSIDYHTFAKIWVDIFHEENAGLDALLARVSLPKYLLSNTNHIVHSRYIAHTKIIKNHFPRAQRILSYEVKAMKPHLPIYEEAFRRAKLLPTECLFVDDLPQNIVAWTSIGGVGIIYNAHHDPIEMLETKLVAHGVICS